MIPSRLTFNRMPEVTLKAIEDLLDLKLDEKLDAKLAPIQQSQRDHTTALDNIAKDVKLLLDEKTISAARIDRLEKWAHEAGEKIGVQLDLNNLPLLKN